MAYLFNWPPSELLNLTLSELEYWVEQAQWAVQQLDRGR
ncbi:GpE family phage tail protein [Dethiosulfatarculus sandiegensis]|nr:GpE family phage tail protein [Dethiosulfatarculus sandiegensis]